MYNDSNKSQGSVATHLRCGGLASLQNRLIIVLFVGERIFRIGTLLAKLQAKWFDCFTCPV